MSSDSRGKWSVPSRARLMLRQASELAAVQKRWVVVRQSHVDPGHNERNCRAYGIHFYEAVMARQAASVCGGGSDHQRALDLLDSEIDAFNNLIATQCGSQ